MKSLSLEQPHAVIMVGAPGSGKSAFAEKFADTFNAPLIGHSKIQRFAPDIQSQNGLMQAMLDELVKSRQLIVIDGLGNDPTSRASLKQRLTKAKYKSLIVWVQTDLVTTKVRLAKSLRKTGVTPDDIDKLVSSFVAPTAHENTVVISGRHTYATQARAVLKKLSRPREQNVLISVPDRSTDPTQRHRLLVR